MEENLRVLAEPQSIRAAYLETLRSLMDGYRHACVSHHIDYAFLNTSTNLDRALLRYLTWRQKFRGR